MRETEKRRDEHADENTVTAVVGMLVCGSQIFLFLENGCTAVDNNRVLCRKSCWCSRSSRGEVSRQEATHQSDVMVGAR